MAARTLEAKSPEGEVDNDLVSLGAHFAVHRIPPHYRRRFRPFDLEPPREASLFPCTLHMVYIRWRNLGPASVSDLGGISGLVADRSQGSRVLGLYWSA